MNTEDRRLQNVVTIVRMIKAVAVRVGKTGTMEGAWIAAQCDRILLAAGVTLPLEPAPVFTEDDELTLAERQARMANDYATWGGYRAEDVHAILGDPMRAVRGGPRPS
ncbi:MAG TPA: hypothetical protein VFS75_02755 [Candidatus Paceibacterota bacterium]|nr:hypothetical protein [Candidatus Paceibacterota bacterium]